MADFTESLRDIYSFPRLRSESSLVLGNPEKVTEVKDDELTLLETKKKKVQHLPTSTFQLFLFPQRTILLTKHRMKEDVKEETLFKAS